MTRDICKKQTYGSLQNNLYSEGSHESLMISRLFQILLLRSRLYEKTELNHLICERDTGT